MCLGGKDHRGKMPFSSHHIKGTYIQQDLSLICYLDHLAEVAFVRFLHCSVTQTLLFNDYFYKLLK